MFNFGGKALGQVIMNDDSIQSIEFNGILIGIVWYGGNCLME